MLCADFLYRWTPIAILCKDGRKPSERKKVDIMSGKDYLMIGVYSIIMLAASAAAGFVMKLALGF